MQPAEVLSVDEIDLSDIEFWARPLSEREGAFLTLREQRPLPFFPEPDLTAAGLPMGPGYYAVTRYADIVEISRQPERYCSGKGATSMTDLPEMFNDYFGSMINMDDPRHARLRKIVSGTFTPRMLKKTEDDVARLASVIVDRVLEARSGDFVADVAAPLPLQVICAMMGIPESESDTVLRCANTILSGGDADLVGEGTPAEVIAKLLNAGAELHALMERLAADRRQQPTDDLTSALVNANVDGEMLTDQELGSFFILLVVAGSETTRNALSHGLHLLTAHPDERAALMADPARVLPTAVEEIVRVASPVIWMRRTVTEDAVLRGVELHAGDKLMLNYWSANRDAEVFPDPFRFDVRRDPNPHVGFGGPGPHFCLGAHLARREIAVMLRELLRRAPRIASVGSPAQLRSSFINGIKQLAFTIE